MEEIITIVEVYNLCTEILGFVDDEAEVIPPELITVINTFNDGEVSNDMEKYLEQINTSLMYNDDVTALSEISQRLEVIDTRLDKEFIALNDCFSFISTALLCFICFKFLNWLVRAFSV